jgi:hypothetical protein
MRSENGDPMPRVLPAPKPRPRLTRSRLAKPLLTSLGTATMLAASSFVLLAVSSTGSAKPWDWTRADPAGAVGRYVSCGYEGLGAIGCMLSAGFRPAAATGAASHRAGQPLVSVATVQDPAPAQAAGSAQAARPAAHGSPASGRAGSQHLVKLPANATMRDMFAACQAAMKTAQTQGATAMRQVEDECEADLAPSCPSLKTSQTQGAAAIQEMEDECEAPAPRPSASPHDD